MAGITQRGAPRAERNRYGSAMGPKPAVLVTESHFRFASDNRIRTTAGYSCSVALFDHLVGTDKQRSWNLYAKLPRTLEVDD